MDEFRGDPLERLCKDVFAKLLSLLDAASLARSVSVSRKWKLVAESDILWEKHCLQLWKDKCIVRTRSLHHIKPSIRAYCLSLEEGHRTRIRIDDLCSCSWNFWYKMEAGSYWVNCDPCWRGLQPVRRYFHRDGYVSADPDDPLWGGHECRWHFTKVPAPRVHEKHEEKSLCTVSVRINHWPPLRISRTSCWGWRMENFMVVYETSHPNESCQVGAIAGGD
jgi:hypothetical protein